VVAATCRSVPTGSSAGSMPVTYSVTQPAAVACHVRDCSSSRKPTDDQWPYSNCRAAAAVRRSIGSSHQDRSAACTAEPTLLCAHGGPLGGTGRSR
jgi:hypothetical protein